VREELQIFSDAVPFVPFQITMASGQTYIVRHPGVGDSWRRHYVSDVSRSRQPLGLATRSDLFRGYNRV